MMDTLVRACGENVPLVGQIRHQSATKLPKLFEKLYLKGFRKVAVLQSSANRLGC